MAEDADLLVDIKKIFLKVMQQNVTLMAVPEESAAQQIVALAVLAAHSRNDEIETRVSRIELPSLKKITTFLT